MVFTRPLISESSSPIINPLVTYQVHQIQLVSPSLLCSMVFFTSLARSRHFLFTFLKESEKKVSSVLPCDHLEQSLFVLFCFTITWQSPQSSFFLLSLGLVVWLRLGFLFVSKSQRSLWVSFSRTNSGLCIYHFFVCSNLKFLHNSAWITSPT